MRFLLVVLAFATGAQAQVRSTMESRVLGETRRLIVHLPESYAMAADKRYPVLFVLDGTSQDGHTVASASALARSGAMPEIIVVALPNVSGGRPRDYTPPYIRQDTEQASSPMGRADRFLEFIKSELIPHIDATYRTAPFRMIAGHSRGAMFVGWSLLADPELFNARFAHSPTFHREENLLASKFAEFLKANPSLKTFFYMSVGTMENPGLTAGFEAVEKVLAAQAPPGLRWHADRTPEGDHQSNPRLATPVGFRALYGRNQSY
jgi:predicted alpha/beta superfamily hydrolase